MSVKINDCLNVIGVAGITVSQIDDTLFIANDRLTTFGVPNSVAIYSDEFGNIKSSWYSTLRALLLKSYC